MVTPYVPAPSYAMDPIDVWGNFQQGMEVGGALRQRARERQYGEAYREGGFGAVADTAGGLGDLGTAEAAGTVEETRRDTAAARAQRNASVLSNAATSLLQVPYEQRGAALERMAPMLGQMGLDPEGIANFDPTDEALETYRALAGQFSRYTDIRQQGDAIVGITADGQVEVLRQEQPDAPAGYQRREDGSGVEPIPGYRGPIRQPAGGQSSYPDDGYDYED